MSGYPTISVVVPTHERPEALRGCLHSLARNRYPKEHFEVIVVNDGGRDPSAVVEELSAHLEVTLIDQPNSGPATARNVGARRARGDLLAFIDDDCTAEPVWLGELAAQHKIEPNALLGGQVVNSLTTNPYAAASQLILEIVYEQSNHGPEGTQFLTTNNLAVPAAQFHRLGGFDSRFRTAEDREFCDRWLAEGLPIAFVPKALVQHAHNLTLRGFCRQLFNYGRGASDFHALRRERRSGTMAGSLNFHRDPRKWLFGPLRRPEVTKRLSTAALLVTWQLANALGFAWNEVSRRIAP